MNDIFEDEDGFYYWSGDYTVGPFDTYALAEQAYSASLRWLAKDEQQEMRKFRDEGV